MELNKKNIKIILLIISASILLFWGLNHLELVGDIIGGAFSVIAPFIVGLCLAFVFNVLLRPLENLWNKIFKKKKGKLVGKLRRPVCLVLSILIIFAAIFILLFMIIPEITRTVSTIANSIPSYLEKIEVWWIELKSILEQYSIVIPTFDLDFNKIAEAITNLFKTSGLIDKTVDITGNIFNGVFNVVLGLVFSVYILAGKEKLGINTKKTMLAFLPKEKVDKAVDLAALSNKTFTKFITGQLTEAVIIGILCFIGMLIFRMPYALTISVLVAFTALIPVFGAFIGTAIGAFLILMVEPMKAFWFIIFIIVLQQLEGNLIYPKVVGKSVGLPGIWVITAVTIGSGMFGVLGMLLAVPVVSVLYTIVKEFINKRLKFKKLKVLED
ncbi:MAG: AI-2E family transporter [Oscillospiraceae bacterium]|nr:AI-2E family transporter [Oscillospiraceae bacterium]